MFLSLAKAAFGVVTIPVTVIADVVTLGGSLTDRRSPYTAEQCSDIMRNLERTIK